MNADLNALTTPGVYRVPNTVLNAPTAAFIGVVQVFARDAGRIVQVAHRQNGDSLAPVSWARASYGTAGSPSWSAWRTSASQRINNPGGQPGVEVLTWDEVNGREQALLPVGVTLGTVDLNAVTLPGVYRQSAVASATLARNYPAADVVGVLTVAMVDPAGPTLLQQFQLGNQAGVARGTYQRRLFGSSWTPWYFAPSQRVDQTAGRAVYTWDDVNGREQLVYGDTGWRNIESLLLNGWSAVSGQIRIRRVGAMVFLRMAGVSPSAATSDAFMVNLSGFNSSFSQGWFAGSSSRLLRQQAGEFQIINKGTGQIYDNFGWSTDDVWPTSLPGTSASSPVVN